MARAADAFGHQPTSHHLSLRSVCSPCLQCQQCGAEHGIDVDLRIMLRHFCQHPEDLPICPSLLAQRCAEAAAMANSSDSGAALPPEQEPLLAREHARGSDS